MVATYRVGLPRLTERTISRYLVAAPIAYYVFDLLWSEGADITSEIVLDRRTRLQEVISVVPGNQLRRIRRGHG
jgi:ATP-dependent DNA ligase